MTNFAGYFQIIECVKNEFAIFEKYFKNHVKTSDLAKFNGILDFYFSKKGKRLRPALIFLLLRALGAEVSAKHYHLAFANEMIHNATLLHDDIIDNAKIRHSLPSVNSLYDNKLAVLAGDYLLSLALNALSEIGNSEVIKIHTASISRLILGEIGQYFAKDENFSIENYIQKSSNKTAELFRAGLLSSVQILDFKENINQIEQFSLNFGIAFQIYNDLQGVWDDYSNGIKTAPIVFYYETTKEPFNEENFKNSNAFERTNALISKFSLKAIENISFIEDNQYKNAIIDLCKTINQW